MKHPNYVFYTAIFIAIIFCLSTTLQHTTAQLPGLPSLTLPNLGGGLPAPPGGGGGGGLPELPSLGGGLPELPSLGGGLPELPVLGGGGGAPPLPGASSSSTTKKTLPTITKKANVDMSIEGWWVADPNNPCRPTGSCCCAKDVIQIKPGEQSSATKVYGELADMGCNGFKTIESVFDKFLFIPTSVVSDTVATWSVPVYNYNYRGEMSEDGNEIKVFRTDQKNSCVNTFLRGEVEGTSGGTATPVTPSAPAINTEQDLTNPGKFSSTAKPAHILPAGKNSHDIAVDVNHNIKVEFVKVPSGANDAYDVKLTVVPLQGLFTSSVTPQWVTLHYISPTSADPTIGVEANPNNRQMTGSGLAWTFSAIRIPNGLATRIAFSYLVGAGTIYNTETIFYAPGGVAGSSSTSSGGAAVAPTATTSVTAPTTIAGKWAGTYPVDSSKCTPGPKCCCAMKEIIVEEIAGSPSKVRIKATLDGSNTCNGMTDVEGEFDFEGDMKATYAYPDSPLTLIAEMSANFDTVSFSNSIYDCKSYGKRSTPAWASVPKSASNSGGAASAPATIAGKWAGTYPVDSSKCTPGPKCCCAMKEIVVEEVSGNTKKVRIKATLDGSNTCNGMTDVEGEFDFEGDMKATYAYPDSPLTLIAEMSSNFDTVSFSNSIYDCKSYGKRSAPAWAAASSGGASAPATVPGKWSGSYKVNAGKCTPGPKCCCALGDIIVEEIPGNAKKVMISATLDGSNTCNGMKDVSGDFDLETNEKATYAYPDSPLTLIAEMSSKFDTLSFSNSIYDCKSYGERDAPAWTAASSSGGGGGSGPTPTTVPGKWAGTYPVDSSKCTPAKDCCCALGDIIVEEIPGNTKKAKISATLDGSSTCNGMKDVSGDFDLETSSKATYAYPDSPLTLIAEMSSSFDNIQFSNSIYKCKSYGSRPAPQWGDSADDGDIRNAITGYWDPTGRCRPTSNCCCLQGALRIFTPKQATKAGYTIPPDYDANDPSLVFVVGGLDGGLACMRRKSLEGVCQIDFTTNTGECMLQGIFFQAEIDNGAMLIRNDMYLNCNSIAHKRDGGWIDSAASSPYQQSIFGFSPNVNEFTLAASLIAAGVALVGGIGL